MADIDARILNIQHELSTLLARVKQGEVLSKEEAQAIMACRTVFDELKQVDTYKEVMRGSKLKDITDKWVIDVVPVKPKLPECYNSRVYFQPKGEEKTYIKHFGNGEGNTPMLIYTKDVNEAKLFRSHVGWMGTGPDHDSYHVMLEFLRTFFTMDGHQYRVPIGDEINDAEASITEFGVESFDGNPRITFYLLKL